MEAKPANIKIGKKIPEPLSDLDKDLEEINKYFASRQQQAASKNSAQENENSETPSGDIGTTNTRKNRRRSRDQFLTTDEDGMYIPQPRTSISKYLPELDFNDEDENFLSRFKRERDSMLLPEEAFQPRRREETEEIIRERTRNIRSVVDQQADIVQSMKSASKSLDELERELREVRQVSLDRRARLEALENAVDTEYRMYETEQQGAVDRCQHKKNTASVDPGTTNGVKEEAATNGGSSYDGFQIPTRVRRPERYRSEPPEEESYSIRRRSGSVSNLTGSNAGYGSGSANNNVSSRASISGSRTNLTDMRLPPLPPRSSGAKMNPVENEPDNSSNFDRRRGSSLARDRYSVDMNNFGVGDSPSLPPSTSTLLQQQKPRTRASIATFDMSSNISADDFLAKIRSKYSFLNPALASSSSSDTGYRPSGGSAYSSRHTSPSPSTSYISSRVPDSSSRLLGSSSGRYRIDDSRLRGSSPSSYLSSAGDSSSYAGRYSSRDSHSPGYGSGGYGAGSSFSTPDPSRFRRAMSVSDVSHYDRPSSSAGSYREVPSGEFKSRFLDKVREKRAMSGDDSNPADRNFKSRFIKNGDGTRSSSAMSNGTSETAAESG